ncbi:MAG: SpoIVB peptidase S55 domain-containing protein, partial [Erysipelotrichaceae bacterium]
LTSFDIKHNKIENIIKKCCPLLDTSVSWSPIIQNGKIIGTVNHVFGNDLTRVCNLHRIDVRSG